MLPEVLLPLDPLVYPPDPPLAFANERDGAPIRDSTITAATSCVVLKMIVLPVNQSAVAQHATSTLTLVHNGVRRLLSSKSGDFR